MGIESARKKTRKKENIERLFGPNLRVPTAATITRSGPV